MTQQSSIKTDLPTRFKTLSGEAVPATVKQITFEASDEACLCELLFEIDGVTAIQAVDEEWFHLFSSAIVTEAAFDGDQPVVARAMLRPSLSRRYAALGLDAEDVFDALLPVTVASDSTDDSVTVKALPPPVTYTECWMALELKQAVKLPEQLAVELTGPGGAEIASLTVSLRTNWSRQLTETDPTELGQVSGAAEGQSSGLAQASPGAASGSLGDQIATYLQAKELKFEQLDAELLRLRFNSQAGSWISLIRINEDDQFCAIYSVFPIAIPAQRREELAALLMSQNYDLTYGSFEMDDEDGELRFRSTLFTAGSFELGMLGFLLAEHLKIMEHYLPLVNV